MFVQRPMSFEYYGDDIVNAKIQDVPDMTPEAYRQKLSRIRKKMADFLGTCCGEYGSGRCRCRDRINYAISSHRLDPPRLDYTSAGEIPPGTMLDVKCAMTSRLTTRLSGPISPLAGNCRCLWDII